jgi:hypothetical protein
VICPDVIILALIYGTFNTYDLVSCFYSILVRHSSHYFPINRDKYSSLFSFQEDFFFCFSY